MTEKRFTLEKDYDCDGSWEYCYQDNETGRRFNFADDNCDTDFLESVNAVIDNLKKENKKLKAFKEQVRDEIQDRYDLSNHKPVFMFMAKNLGLELFE